MGIRIHHELDGALAVHPFAFVQSTDPALDADNHVTAHKAWIDTGNGNTLKVRNDTNTAWLTVISGGLQTGIAFYTMDYIQKDVLELPHSDILDTNFDFTLVNHI